MNIFKAVGLLIFLAVVLGLLIFNFDKETTKKTTSALVTLPPNEILKGLATELGVKSDIRQSIYFDWIEGNTLIPLTGEQFIVGTVDIKNLKEYDRLQDIESITFSALQPIESAADAYLQSLGFRKNLPNTITLESNPSFKFVGLENADTKCIIRLDEHTDPFATFFCGRLDTSQVALQKQMGNILPYELTPEGIESFRVQKIEGDFAIGTASQTYTGYTWIAKRADGKWQVIWQQNDIALCSDMERLGIPKSIYGECSSES